MAFIDTDTGRYPISETEIRARHNNVSFPDVPLEEWGPYRPVQRVAPPPETAATVVTEDAPEFVNGAWRQTWVVSDASPETLAVRLAALRDTITAQVQSRLDAFAQTRGYDNIVSACSYATSSHPRYGPEGRYCVQAREDTWDVLFGIEADILAGTRQPPSGYEDIEPLLPALAWPVA